MPQARNRERSLESQEVMTRRAVISPESFDETALTVEAAISTFSDVQRHDRRGVYVERLDPAGLDTSRLIGAPVLDGHRQASARDTIGVVTAFRTEGNALIATIRLLQSDDVRPIVERIRQGVIRGVSVGYRVQRWADSLENKVRVRTAAAWSIFEVSAVPVPADPGATFRSENMQDEVIDPPAEDTPAQTRATIRTIARAAGMTTEQADDMIDRDLSITEARAEAFEAMQARTRNSPRIRIVSPSSEDPAVIRTRREEALYARVSGTAPTDEARPFMGDTLRDHARALVESAGVSTRGMDADTLFRAAMHTTSDFPQLLTGVGHRTLMAAYQVAGSPLKTLLARQTTLPDFRAASKLKLSDIGLLEKVSESGEIKSTTRGEAAESYALDTYGTMFALSRKALINDDLGAFRDWGATAGRMAAETENNLLFTLFRQSSGAGPVMGEDNKRLFHADHGNLAGAGTALDEANLSAARLAMRGVKALDGKTPINAAPKYLVVGPQLETSAEKLLAAIYAATVATANPFSGKLELLVEPRITDKSWYVFADPAVLPVLEYAYLSSAQGPQMASREGWDVLGQEFRVVLDFGCGATDFRGAYRNPGL
ncbi:peptidase U35 phage prohead HK97 protein [Rhizobium phaseoli]|uniref:prohead protease/major capsid protein fusion protein n=1 Tax=Rhizobium phaseoli TaxID=396 RepID=UPI0007F0EA5F|nr:prohead protease/major capsid protein fusion protein [Rhizobium phaseoli]ANL47954.1 peptidase U35 phage prohead HK97 protein [Rhizobium phaseoli]